MLIGAEKMSPMLRGAVLTQYLRNSSGGWGWKVKFLQLSLGRGKEAQDLLMQTARERGADVLLITEQHKWSENFQEFFIARQRFTRSKGDPLLREAWEKQNQL